MLDDAGFHTRPDLAVPVDDRLVPRLDALVNTVGARRCDLTERQSDIGPRTGFAWWSKDYTPS